MVAVVMAKCLIEHFGNVSVSPKELHIHAFLFYKNNVIKNTMHRFLETGSYKKRVNLQPQSRAANGKHMLNICSHRESDVFCTKELFSCYKIDIRENFFLRPLVREKKFVIL